MGKKKSLQELTLKNNFMFGAVMLDPKNCKGVLERSLGIKIERVEVSKEKSTLLSRTTRYGKSVKRITI